MQFTRVATMKDLVHENWKVWRITTKSGSTYHVGLRDEGGKRLGILRGRVRADGTPIEIHDREPRLDDGQLLHTTPVEQWVGRSLEFGTATTSPIVRVEEELDRQIVTAVTGVGLVPANPARPAPPREAPRSKYPIDFIEGVEAAATFLRRAYQKNGLAEDLRRDPQHLERMQLALTDCALILQALGRKIANP